MNKFKSLLSAAVALCFLAGCAETQPRFTGEVIEKICVPDTGKLEAMQTAEDVLSRMHFTIDKADVEQGYITTRPLPGAQFFEFWRSDNVGAFNSAEANLHCIRRTVELNINREAEKLCIGCDVKVQRLSLPERQVSSSSRAYDMFSRSTARMQQLNLHPEQRKEMAWLDLGKDTSLATEILKRLEKRLKRE